MTEIVVFLFEGASLGVLMLYHLVNFQHGRLFTSREEDKKPYTLISSTEFFIFTDDEVNNIDLSYDTSEM